MRRRFLTAMGGAVVVTAAACGGGAEHAAPVPPAPVRARVGAVEAVELPGRLELYGTVEASRSAAVSSRVMATVTAVRVRPGDHVAAGAVLVEIDPETARGQEAQARGGQAQAQAGLALAERNYERFKALAAKGAASEMELDVARMQYEQARGAVEQGQGAVTAAASVARESRVVAPFAGRVTAKLVEVGDLAAPGRPLVMLESSGGRRLVLAVPESLAAGLALGQTLPVRLDGRPDLGELAGRIEEIAPGADPTSHTFAVKVALTEAEVPSGVAGRAWLPRGARRAVTVQREAVVARGGLDLVVVRDGEGRARSRVVTLGAPLEGGRVEVLSGLAGGETVLLGLAQAPADGAEVEVQP